MRSPVPRSRVQRVPRLPSHLRRGLTVTFAFQLPLSLLKTAQNHPMVRTAAPGHLSSRVHTPGLCSSS